MELTSFAARKREAVVQDADSGDVSAIDDSTISQKRDEPITAPPDGGFWAWTASKLKTPPLYRRLARNLTVDSCWRTSGSHEHMVRSSVSCFVFRNLSF